MTSKRVQAAIRDAFADGGDVFCEYCTHRVYLNVDRCNPKRATGDHRTPFARGGKDTRRNIAVVCYWCNARKGPLTEQEFLAFRHDRIVLGRLIAEWNTRLNGGTLYDSRTEQKVAKRERRNARLTERLRIPDPGCVECGGTGKVRMNTHLERYCPCALQPLTPEAAAAYIDGRRTSEWRAS